MGIVGLSVADPLYTKYFILRKKLIVCFPSGQGGAGMPFIPLQALLCAFKHFD